MTFSDLTTMGTLPHLQSQPQKLAEIRHQNAPNHVQLNKANKLRLIPEVLERHHNWMVPIWYKVQIPNQPAELAPQDDIPQLSGSVSEESPRRATDKTSVSEAGPDQSTSSDVYDDRTRVDLSMFDNVSPTGSDAVEDTPTNVPKENQAESTSKIPETVPTSSVSHITIGQDLGNIENQEAVKSEQMVQATHESAVKVIRRPAHGPAHEPTHELAPQVAHQQSGNMAASRSDTLLTTERSHGSLSQTPSDVLIKAPAINVQRKRPQSARPASRQDVVTGATLTDSESNHTSHSDAATYRRMVMSARRPRPRSAPQRRPSALDARMSRASMKTVLQQRNFQFP
eukprot:1004400_1